MLECRACFSRTLSVLSRDSEAISRRNDLILTPQLITRPTRRYLSGSTNKRQIADVWKKPIDDRQISADATSVKSHERALRTELKYLPDSVKLAEHVRYTIRCDKPDKALELCRMASKTMSCVVSWNHVLGWHMEKGKVDDALKIYNEMKKRAQFPDAYTYSILLSGLSRPHHHGSQVKAANVAKAVSVYNSMYSPTSRVEPGIIHTNAALRVCAMGLDMDALWGIVSRIPERGSGSADYITYSIILDAIRHSCTAHTTHEVEQSQKRQAGINEGRKIWQEVAEKWRNGQILVDEDLVCSMARLLLVSKQMADWDDVLSLVEQTMKIPRQISPIGSDGRHTEHVPPEAAASEEEPEVAGEEHVEYDSSDAPAAKVFKPVQILPHDPTKPHRPKELSYTQPGNAILSVLTDACSQLRINKVSSLYWNLLTSPPYNVKPDLDNLIRHLRLLSINRSSARVAALFGSDFFSRSGLAPRNLPFRIAISACMRDKNNKDAIAHAGVVVDAMMRALADPDVHTLTQYLNLALHTKESEKIVEALNRLHPVIQNLRSRVAYGSDQSENESRVDRVINKSETVVFLQTMIGTIDTLVKHRMVPERDHQHWVSRRKVLDAFVAHTKQRIQRNSKKIDESDGEREELRRKRDVSKVRSRRIGIQIEDREGLPPKPFMLAKFRAQGRKQDAAMRRAMDAGKAENHTPGSFRKWDGDTERGSDVFKDSPADL